nr:hypothetical protein [Tanacetum cinerariifolium]
EEEEHLAPADSSIVPIVDPVPLVGDTEAFETNESVPTHGSSQAIIPISQTRLHRARKTIRLEPPMSTSIEACIARHAAALTPSLPVPSPPLLLPSPLTTSPTDIGAPLGYRAAGIKMRALLPSTSHRTDIPQADMPPRKRAFLTTPAPRFEVRESSAAGATRQLGPDLEYDRRQYRTTSLQTQLTTALGRIEILEARDPEPQEGPTEAGSSCVAAALAGRYADRSRNGDNRSTLTWWNSHVKVVRQEVAYAMSWTALKRMITDKYCPMGEIQKLESEMFPAELVKVERYVGGLPDMIHGSVKASKPQSIHEAIEFATKMMDKKMLTHVERQAEHKRKFDDTSRNNQNQQQPFKRNNVARAYIAGPGDKKPYGGIKPLNITCFKGGVQGHFKSDCPKLRNGNQGNQAGNGNAVARAYVVGTVRTNPNSNVVTGTFLLYNRYALILFDTGADRSFISTAFSSLIDIIPTTLDHGYDVELAEEYVPRDHVPMFFPEFEHPEDLVPAEDEAPASLLPPGFLSPHIRPLSPRALGAEMNAIASSLYHSLHPSGIPPLLPIPLYTPSTSRRAGIPEADTPPRNRLLLATPRPSYVETRLRDTERRMMAALELVNMRVSYQVDVCTRESSKFCTRHHDAQKDRATVRAEIEVLRSERLSYEQEGIQTREALARSEAYYRALEARVAVLENHARRLEWQRQAADDLAVQHIMRT